MPGKLGRTSEQRIAMLRNQASCLLWYGKIETTKARAKQLRSYVEKIITAAINTYDDTIEDLTKKTEEEMLKVRNLGRKSLDEVIQKLESYGLSLEKKED